tara:strand:+ start:105 stop:479 length:375 start_codon:yes stop_codon:yes gene_type:complete
MKNTKTFYENTILENIDFTDYGISNESYEYDKIKTLYNIFKSEYVHDNNKHINETNLFSDWLRGLPTVLTVPFYNYDILEKAKESGALKINSNNDKYIDTVENKFLLNYWVNLSNAFFTLKENL